MNSDQDRMLHPVILSMLRNIISKYPEYEYIKNRKPYINKKDNRLYADMGKVSQM